MKYTLLEMTQRILSAMESDEVGSINDTVEAQDVASIIKECYFEIVGGINPTETEGLFKFDASGSSLQRAVLLIPNIVSRVHWIQYRDFDDTTGVKFKNIPFISNEEFLYYQSGFQSTDTNVEVQGLPPLNGIDFSFYCYNDRIPSYYTIFDEQYCLFDAYDSAHESTLTQASSRGYGTLIPAFSMTDAFIPDLDPRQFQLLLNEAKATAFVELKQTPNPRAESKARRNHIRAIKQKNDNDPCASIQTAWTFGRKGPGQRREIMKRAMRQGR